MAKDTYLTIESLSEGLFKSKGSKFIAYAYPISSEDEAKNILTAIKKTHHSARHHCWAYKIGSGNDVFRVNDDGEPSNSAGKPILGQIQSFHLTNVFVVVVRYFGGTLLGVGGLIEAYREATKDALKNAHIIEAVLTDTITVHFEYTDMNNIMKMVKDYNLEIVEQQFEISCSISLKIRKGESKKIVDLIQKIQTVHIVSSDV